MKKNNHRYYYKKDKKEKQYDHTGGQCGSSSNEEKAVLHSFDEENDLDGIEQVNELYSVVAVRFKQAGKKYFFDPRELDLSLGDHVLVETARGIEFGEVVSSKKEVSKDEIFLPIKPILRLATKEDITRYNKNKEEEQEVLVTCQHLVEKNKLAMRLLACEYTFDRTKLIIYFSAESRIDFRQLVKDLASVFKTRIELRQVGVRDAAKYVGGIGPCGRILCCNTFLGNFDTVSIKMAKNQHLSLNPQKISGVCGKLLCCIRYEADFYDEMAEIMPNEGEVIMTPDGEGRVIGMNALIETVKVVLLESSALRTYSLDDVHRVKPKNNRDEPLDEELLSLEDN